MKLSITDNFHRINLHDTLIKSINRFEQAISVALSHGYLENYNEHQINEPIVFDDGMLTLNDIHSETYQAYTKTKPEALIYINPPPLFDTAEYDLISINEFSETEDHLTFKFEVFRYEFHEEKDYHIEWTIKCKSACLNWRQYILHKHWLHQID